MVKKLILLVFSICFILLTCELWIRYQFQAWPFESVLYVPDYLTTRDTTLRWRFSSSDGRNSLGLRNRELGPKKTWVSSYSNDVMAYIPSRRVLDEGGYEGGEARYPYGLPAPWDTTVEEKIVHEVHKLAAEVDK